MIFFFNDTATTEIYTLSLHDALPISLSVQPLWFQPLTHYTSQRPPLNPFAISPRSEEHTSELQSHSDLVCRLLLEKKQSRPRPREAVRRAARAVGRDRVAARGPRPADRGEEAGRRGGACAVRPRSPHGGGQPAALRRPAGSGPHPRPAQQADAGGDRSQPRQLRPDQPAAPPERGGRPA